MVNPLEIETTNLPKFYMIGDKLKTLRPYKPRALGTYVHPEIFMRSDAKPYARPRLNFLGSRRTVPKQSRYGQSDGRVSYKRPMVIKLLPMV